MLPIGNLCGSCADSGFIYDTFDPNNEFPAADDDSEDTGETGRVLSARIWVHLGVSAPPRARIPVYFTTHSIGVLWMSGRGWCE